MPKIAVAVLTLGIVIAATTARADPIRITHGALVGNDFSARLTAGSADGRFTLDATGDRVGGIYEPPDRCNIEPACVPRTMLSLDARWSDSDFPGVATVDGTSYRLSGGNQANAFVSFTGAWTAPDFSGRYMASVRVPFAFEGIFFYPEAPGGPLAPLPLIGSGMATLRLHWSVDRSWQVLGTRYEFSRANATPEPTSLLLLSSGVAGLLLRRRSRL